MAPLEAELSVETAQTEASIKHPDCGGREPDPLSEFHPHEQGL